MAREVKTNLSGDQIKAIIDAEQAKYDGIGNTEAYMALARVLRVIAAQEVEASVTRRSAPVTRKQRAAVTTVDTSVWPPKDC
jgi:hypothetical protein